MNTWTAFLHTHTQAHVRLPGILTSDNNKAFLFGGKAKAAPTRLVLLPCFQPRSQIQAENVRLYIYVPYQADKKPFILLLEQ